MPNGVQKQCYGVIGFFDHPEKLMAATRQVREGGYQYFDAYTPYPVHGLDAAQGLKRSPLPWITFFAGLTGGILGFLLQYWTSVVDWPINVGGKPMNSWPAFVPVMFECTILFAGLATVGGMFLLNRLPNHGKKAFDPRITQDQFALVIQVPPCGSQKGADFREEEVQSFLRRTGAQEVKSVYAEGWF